jgi:hypothetical protein
MTWEEAARQPPQFIAYRIDAKGIVHYRYHGFGTVAILAGKPVVVSNIYDALDDWQPFHEGALLHLADRSWKVSPANID